MTTPKIDPETVARYYAYTIMWTLDGVEPSPDPCGDWVRFSDYQALAARVAELESLLQHGLQECAKETVRAEAAEAKLAEREARVSELEKFEAGWAEAEGKLTDAEAREAKLREVLAEAVEVAHKAYVAATMEAVNAGPSHPLKDNFDKWRVRCMNAETNARAILREIEK